MSRPHPTRGLKFFLQARAALAGFTPVGTERVRVADTFGASQSIPAYLRLVGTVAMGAPVRRTIGKREADRVAAGHTARAALTPHEDRPGPRRS